MEEEWTVDSSEAITISLVRPSVDGGAPIKINSFHPKFTYEIFGDDERIFGYKGLNINLRFCATDLRPNLSVTSQKQFKAVGDIAPVDIRETLQEFLPAVALQKSKDYENALNSISDDWTPPGELVRTFEKDGETYEIWRGTMDDPTVKQMVKRIQIVVLFFIEGGSFIGQDAEGNDHPDYDLARWSVFFLYKKTADAAVPAKHQYTFQGYSTAYHYWRLLPPTPPASPSAASDDSWELPDGSLPLSEIPQRVRISQFVILPPFQGKGAGAMLYNTIFDLQMKSSTVTELTIEDPNESFDLLRDLCDMKYLRDNVADFAKLKVNTDVRVPFKGGTLHHSTQVTEPTGDSSASGIVDISGLESIRIKNKIAPRQFWRLTEMHLMSQLPPSVRAQADAEAPRPKASKEDTHAYTLWRLLLKQRLYRRNINILGEMPITERIIKLNETVDNVEWEYATILERLVATPSTASGSPGNKRKMDDDTDDANSSTSKKVRVEGAA